MGDKIKNYQKANTLFLYYFGLLLFTFAIALPTRKLAEHLETIGYQNMTVVSYITVITLFLGVLFNGANLLSYNNEISNLDEHDIAHVARNLYISPFVNLATGFIAGICIWYTFNFLSIVIEEDGNFALAAIFLSVLSFRVSPTIERMIFKE